MSETEILSKIEALVQLMQVGGITWQRTNQLSGYVSMLQSKTNKFTSKNIEKPPENIKFTPERTKPIIPYPYWYGSDR